MWLAYPLLVSQVCAPERKKHAAHTGAGGKKAAITNAKSRAVKEGMMLLMFYQVYVL